MDTLNIAIDGDRRAGLRFEEFPDALYSDLRDEIGDLTSDLYAKVIAATPTATGDLSSKVRLREFADKNRITGYIDVAGSKGSQDFAKAGALEYGAHRAAKVGKHKMRLDHYWDKKLASPQTVLVEAFSRQTNIAEQSFMRRPLETMKAGILARLNETVARATSEANA